MPMDNLRDRIRSRKHQTQDLPNSMENLSQSLSVDEDPPKTGTHDLLKQLSAGQPTAELNLKPTGKQSIANSLMDKLKPLEVNKKMLVVSIIVAGVASLLAINYLNTIANPLKEQSKPIQVLMLTQDVKARTVIKQEMLAIKEIPSGFLPKGVLAYEPGVKILGKVALTDLYQGEVLHEKRIALPNQSTGVSMIIPAGHRAIAVRTNDAQLMKPSDHVDVIASIPDPVRRGKSITYPILQDATILAVGNQLSSETPEPNRYGGAQNITVAVPEDRVTLMSLIAENGKFNVVLRAPGDKTKMAEAYTVEEVTDALSGNFEHATKTAAKTLSGAEKELQKIKEMAARDAAKETKNDPIPAKPLVDLSGGGGGGTPAYRAPAPVYRAPVYRAPAPVYRAPAAPVYRAPAPAAPVYRAPAAPKTVTVINGGTMTQVNGGN